MSFLDGKNIFKVFVAINFFTIFRFNFNIVKLFYSSREHLISSISSEIVVTLISLVKSNLK